MKTMRGLVFACFVVLVLAPPAVGKGPLDVKLCGSFGCKTLPAGTSVVGAFGGSWEISPPPAPAPYFELRAMGGHGNEVRGVGYVPSARALWHGGTWSRLTSAEDARWQRLVSGLKPFAAPIVRRVTVDGRSVEDPASYLAIYAVRPRVTTFSGAPQLLVMYSAGSSPWTGAERTVDFYPRQGVAVTAGTIFPLPPSITERIRLRQSLRVAE